MSIDVGTTIPDLSVGLDDGSRSSLGELAGGRHLVVFFYPKAFTGGCTAEACHFRDLSGEFDAAGAARVGVSADDADTQSRFSAEHGFDFPLIADTDGEVAAAFGANRLGLLPPKRQTFVLDPALTVRHVTSSETDMERHADDALAFLLEHTTG